MDGPPACLPAPSSLSLKSTREQQRHLLGMDEHAAHHQPLLGLRQSNNVGLLSKLASRIASVIWWLVSSTTSSSSERVWTSGPCRGLRLTQLSQQRASVLGLGL